LKRLVIIGADAAGMSAASEARRADPALKIIAYDRGGYASYSQCGLPYWIGGVVDDQEKLIARTVAEFTKQTITVNLQHEVTAIDPARGEIHVHDRAGDREFTTPYDALLIATGATPVRPQVPGLDLDGVFVLDVMEDALAIREYISRYAPRRAVIVGGGYIGLELAENLVERGIETRIVQRSDQLFGIIDRELAERINTTLAGHGVNLDLCDTVVESCVGATGRVDHVHTAAGELPADLVILAVGILPAVSLAAPAGIALGTTGAIAVDRQQRTNLSEHYAAGDCAEVWHRLLQRPVWAALGTIANKQGRVAGRVIAGGEATYGGVVGTAITRVFDLEIGRVGLTEREAEAEGFDIVAATLDSTDHAGYMPDARDLTVKLVAERGSGRLLGGQVLGQAGVAQRVDVLATALYAELTLEGLTRLDLAYAPPFNSVYDPIQVAATSLLRKGL
jgi:NADPH-dependent 2,4-dienoyl-CoA reductase/sulfur reductase-like enzyme